jgi:hypothetical protein
MMIGSDTENNKESRAFSEAIPRGFPSQSFDVYHHHSGDHVYDYHPAPSSLALKSKEMKGCKGEDYSFPVRLHYLLEVLQQDGLAHLACWMPHGR